jgi:TPR repeat protein
MPKKLLFPQAVLAILAASGLAQAPSIDSALLARANAGDPAAQVSVGEEFAQAAASSEDREDAADAWKQSAAWYKKAADRAYIPGEIHLADAYSYGRGVDRDKVKAAELYRQAAEQGDPSAQGTLAMLYSLGQGVPKDDVEAYFWFDLAAQVKTPNQDRYLANRQNVGTHITVEELERVQQRLKKWKAAHPRPAQ